MRKIVLPIISGILGGLVMAVAYHFLYNPDKNAQVLESNVPAVFTSSAGNALLPDFTNAAEKSIHSVVHVKTQYSNTYTTYNSVYDFFFGNGSQRQEQTPLMPVGSGVIISSDGYVVTNNHVIEQADYVEVTLNDKRTYTAKVVGADPSTDIALLKIDASDLPFIPYGNSDNLKIGEWVLAVGNPFNLTSTVTAGIVSAKARNINILSPYSIESFIQTDAAVNPGNSGGALVNTQGELIGINTAIASQTGNYIGYSFAIPVNMVKKIVSDIIEFGEVQRAYLGVSIQALDQRLAAEKGINETQGVYVEDVYNEGSAFDAGLKSGDIILGINDFSVSDIPQLQEQLSKYRPGDHVTVTISRKGDKKNLQVVLKNRNNGTDILLTPNAKILGASFEELAPDERRKLGLRSGIKIADIGTGKLNGTGIRPGFIITHINKQPVATVDDIKYLFDNAKGTVLVEGKYPNGIYAYYSFGI